MPNDKHNSQLLHSSFYTMKDMFFYKEYKKTKFLFYTPIRLIYKSIYQYVPSTIHTTHIE